MSNAQIMLSHGSVLVEERGNKLEPACKCHKAENAPQPQSRTSLNFPLSRFASSGQNDIEEYGYMHLVPHNEFLICPWDPNGQPHLSYQKLVLDDLLPQLHYQGRWSARRRERDGLNTHFVRAW